MRTISIIGGGTAGYLAALKLNSDFPDTSIQVITSSKIPVIGVGEGTTPQFLKFLHRDLKIDERVFFRHVEPTIKQSVIFNWGGRQNWHFPAGKVGQLEPQLDSENWEDRSLLSRLTNHNKVPIIKLNGQLIPIKGSFYAYHLENKKFATFLQEIAIQRGIRVVDALVTEVITNTQRSRVTELITDSGKIQSDIYIDCSGARSLLLEQALNVPFVSYSDSIPTNAAWVAPGSLSSDIPTYSRAEDSEYGWMWELPLRNEMHYGYVFSEKYCTVEQAKAHFVQTKKISAANCRLIRFRSGRHDVAWKGNVMALGMSYHFIEPLHASSLDFIAHQLKLFSNILQNKEVTQDSVSTFNKLLRQKSDRGRDLLSLYFKYNSRTGLFWNDCKALSTHTMDYWVGKFKTEGLLSTLPSIERKRFKEEGQFFLLGPSGVDLTLLGLGISPAKSINREQGEADFRKQRNLLWNSLTKKALSHEDALDFIEKKGFQGMLSNQRKQSKLFSGH